MERGEFIFSSLVMLVVVGGITLIGNTIGYDNGVAEAIPGMILIIIIGWSSLILARELPLDLPSVAYAGFITILVFLPFMPTQEFLVRYTDRISLLATATPILAYVGLSISLQMSRLKQVGWKLIVVAIFVFVGTFFGSAIVAHVVLTLQGLI